MEPRKIYPLPQRGFRRPGGRDVRMPSVHEGVGNALRSIYSDPMPGVPAEFARLLEQLS